MSKRRSLTLAASCFLSAVSPCIQAASLLEPLVDSGLASSTPSPDPDLVIVRERTYGAQGVDLTPYGIGTGSDDFVQSIYFRLYPQNVPGQESSLLGTVTFPPGVRILGFISSSTQLGRTTAGGAYTQSDALFAVAANPDDYVAPARGFEMPGTGAGSAEFICQVNERSFVFGLDVIGPGADDFRVIIDYGSSYAPDMTFEVNLSTDTLGNVPASQGIRVGSTTGTRPGDADYGEVTHLMAAPLTTDNAPMAGTTPPVSGRDVIYMIRETGGDPEVDGLDVPSGAIIPSMMKVPPPFLQPPRAAAFGENGLLYVLGEQTGLASIDTVTGDVTNIGLPNLQGVNVRMTTLRGDTRLFILRQTSFPDPEDAFVDTYDTATGIFVGAFATITNNLLPFPVDLIGDAQGRLYALGIGDAFHEIDTMTGAVRPFTFVIPNLDGDNVRGTADPKSSLIYLLRDTTGSTFIDRLDARTGVFTQALFTIPSTTIPDAGAMVVDNQGMLWVFSKNGGGIGLDPAAPAAPAFFQTKCLDFIGTTNYAAVLRSPREVSPPPSRALEVELSSQPGMLKLSWEDLGQTSILYNIYSGSIGSYYSHASSDCHVSPTPGAPGSLSFDIPLPAGDTYFLVTASSTSAEGSAGARPIAATPPACGPAP